jgi:autotransporter family porin
MARRALAAVTATTLAITGTVAFAAGVAHAATTVYASDTAWTQIANGWGPVEKDKSNGENGAGDGTTLTVGGVAYSKGFGVHAVSNVRVPVPAGATTFQAVAGIDAEVGASLSGWGTVVMRVFNPSNVAIYQSGAVNSTNPKTISVTVTGLSYIDLRVASGGDGNSGDHADWANARFTVPDGPKPPTGGYFTTSAPGTALPSESTCAALVTRSTWEPRPQNADENATVPAPGSISLPTGNWGGDSRGEGLKSRISGNFTGTTDEIIQWAACKWGFSDNMIRATAVVESSWHQATGRNQGFGDYSPFSVDCQPGYGLGVHGGSDCPTSFGLLQIKDLGGANGPHHGTFPHSVQSTAFNVDYTMGMRRACYEGWLWLGDETRGDLRGCVGLWFSGEWYANNADYLSSYDGARPLWWPSGTPTSSCTRPHGWRWTPSRTNARPPRTT